MSAKESEAARSTASRHKGRLKWTIALTSTVMVAEFVGRSVTATLLTLLVLPAIYGGFSERREVVEPGREG